MFKLHQPASRLNHEEIFLERYEWLMNWALRFTENDRQQAEDLVHDVFVHFTMERRDLEGITSNIEAYLYGMLRNMHVSQIRRAARLRATIQSEDARSLVDYEFVGDGLLDIERRSLRARDELKSICRYALARRQSSKAGSVLILRFIHGYYPAEIALIIRGSREAANKWLQIARSEAKVYLASPESVAFINQAPVKDKFRGNATTIEDIVQELREGVFNQTVGECLSDPELHQVYVDAPSGLDCETLSHLVGCRDCLNRANELLGLPLLADRDPGRILGQDRRGGKGGGNSTGKGSGGIGSGGFISRARGRLKTVREHKPRQLRVSINGFILGAQDLSSEFNKQAISIKGEEPIRFAEIFSEQEVRLLFATIDPPPEGSVEQRRSVELSEGRTLELKLDFSQSWPVIEVVYHDPAYTAEFADHTEMVLRQTEAEPGLGRASAPIDVRDESVLRNLVRRLSRTLGSRGFWLKPETITALLVLVSAVTLWLTHHDTPKVQAAELLKKAFVAEEADGAAPDLVVHRTVEVEARKATDDVLIARRRVEIWHCRSRALKAVRVYDENESLVAGEWTKPDGSQMSYDRGGVLKRRSSPLPDGASSKFDLEQIERLSPSAKTFSDLTGKATDTTVEERPGIYVIHWQASGGPDAGAIQVWLTIGSRDMHATEMDVQMGSRQGGQAGAQPQTTPAATGVKYRLVETRFERRPLRSVAASVFEPDPELIRPPASAPISGGSKEGAVSSDASSAITGSVASTELEVQVLGLLSQIGADLGEQISATRTPQGFLLVRGVVDTDKRKAEIIHSLTTVASNPAVKIDVLTAAEAAERRSKSGSRQQGLVQFQGTAGSESRIPVYAEVRRFLASRGVQDAAMEDEISRFSIQESRHSREALQHAWALKRIAERFSAEDMAKLNSAGRGNLNRIIATHASAIARETRELQRSLQPVLFPSGVAAAADTGSLDSGELAQAVSRLFEMCSANDQDVRAAFTVATDRSPTLAVTTSTFWQRISTTCTLAEKLRQTK